jgi:hypothetical protein
MVVYQNDGDDWEKSFWDDMYENDDTDDRESEEEEESYDNV